MTSPRSLAYAVSFLAGLSVFLAVRLTDATTRPTGLQRLAEGVYAYLGPNQPVLPENRGWINNAGVVVGRDAVMVVDTLFTHALARELLAAVRQVTDKPIRYVVNTHWHPDHQFGNGVFSPPARVFAHPQTREEMARRGERLVESFRKRFPFLPLEGLTMVLPTDLVDGERTVDLGGRTVRLIHLGKGHTAGDLVVLVPDARVLFAGDLVTIQRIPFGGSGHPRAWIETLNRMEKLSFRILVPGHGPVGTREDLVPVREYWMALREKARSMLEQGMNEIEIQKTLHLERFRSMPFYEETHPRNTLRVLMELQEEL